MYYICFNWQNTQAKYKGQFIKKIFQLGKGEIGRLGHCMVRSRLFYLANEMKLKQKITFRNYLVKKFGSDETDSDSLQICGGFHSSGLQRSTGFKNKHNV